MVFKNTPAKNILALRCSEVKKKQDFAWRAGYHNFHAQQEVIKKEHIEG